MSRMACESEQNEEEGNRDAAAMRETETSPGNDDAR